MSHVRVIVIALLGLGMLSAARAQGTLEPDKKQEAAIRKIQQLLDARLLDRTVFAKEMPLEKLLDALAKQFPKDAKITLRFDRDAFGDNAAEIAATPIRLLPTSASTTVRFVLEQAISQLKSKIDYRIEGVQVVVTTTKNAAFAVEYDIRDVIETPELVAESGAAWRKASPAEKAGMVVGKSLSILEINPQSVLVLNGTRLAVQATGSQHSEIVQLVFLYRRLADLQVNTQARLYEVDDAFHKKLTNRKPIPLEEEERMMFDGKPTEMGALFKLLPKQKRVQSGDSHLTKNGLAVTLLSRHQVVTCLPSPDQLRKGDKARQTILEGVSLVGELHVSPDRRSIRVQLVEHDTEIQAIQKVKLRDLERGPIFYDLGEPPPKKDVFGEVPALLLSKYTQMTEIADGGTILIPVHYRPRSAKEKDRWLVLAITARIRMEEEELRIREQSLEAVLPQVVADVLKNPALKTARDFYGTPGDKRFALVDSAPGPGRSRRR